LFAPIFEVHLVNYWAEILHSLVADPLLRVSIDSHRLF